jgi:poly-gamma-glutamate capsule biosynthesis protein CapA/YwtB (metallophosphatase superfamily)
MIPWRLRRKVERLWLESFRFLPGHDTWEVNQGDATASLIAVGDIALGDGVESSVAEHGVSHILSPVRRLFAGADLRVGNLESVLTSEQQRAVPTGAALKASPAAIEVLCEAKFDALTVANNHCLDYGVTGLRESLDILQRRGIRVCGDPATDPNLPRAARMSAKGLQVTMLGICDEYPARLASGPLQDDDSTIASIRGFKEQSDVVILQVHWGYEFVLFPLFSHRERARRFADAGADLVLVHHAHVPMGIEIWNGHLIAYGLGNFVFDVNAYQRDGHPFTDRTVLLKIFFGHQGVRRVQAVPVGIRRDGSVHTLEGKKRAQVLGCLRRISQRIADDKWLKRIERDRILRESIEFLTYFSEQGASGNSGVLEDRAWFLRSPRQCALMRQLPKSSRRGEEVAATLQLIAEAAESPEQLLALASDLSSGGRARMLAEFSREARLPAEALGRLP